MAFFMPDSNCIIALVSQWHPKRSDVRDALESRLTGGDVLLVAGHSAIESYSVLTRLTPPYRMAPAVAFQLIRANVLDYASAVLPLTSEDYQRVLRDAPGKAISGGRIYDALIAACAVAGGVDEILTLNAKHFMGLDLGSVRVVTP